MYIVKNYFRFMFSNKKRRKLAINAAFRHDAYIIHLNFTEFNGFIKSKKITDPEFFDFKQIRFNIAETEKFNYDEPLHKKPVTIH